MNDVPLWELTELSLSYKNIIEIDNLRGLESLTKLQLDNNIICKIQNIDHLVNLEWLDLSFNLISKIEGLDTLTKLSDLSLYSNKIQMLEGLEKLSELNILSIGKNLIKNHETAIKYLNKLNNKLECVKMQDNPFQKTGGSGADEYKFFAIESLKKLKYLDYAIISPEERDQAKQKHSDDVPDKDQGNAANVDEGVKTVDQELVDAKIDGTHKLIERIQDNSPDAQILKMIVTKYQDCWSNFEQGVDEQTQKSQTDIKKVHLEKKRHITYCLKTLHDSELQAERNSTARIELYKNMHKKKMQAISFENDDKRNLIEETDKELQQAIDEMYNELMNIEMLLQFALQESTASFRDKIKDFLSAIGKTAMEFSNYVQSQAEIFTTQLKFEAMKEANDFQAAALANQDKEEEE